MRQSRKRTGLLVAAVLAIAAGGTVPSQSYPRPGVNALVSLSSDAGQADDASHDPQPSADGRVVAFFSRASDLVEGPVHENGNVFVRDRRTQTTRLASAAHVDGEAPNGSSFQSAISADGRFVAFVSFATNLVPGDDADGQRAQLYLRDLQEGTTERVTSGVDGGGASNGGALGPALSADGHLVAFFSHASDLVAGDTNQTADVFVHDRTTGETRRVTVGHDGSEADGLSAHPVLSGDGRSIAYYSRATNLVAGDENDVTDVFVTELATGATELASVSTDGDQGNYGSFSPTIGISGDGRIVAFQSGASNLVPNDTNGTQNPINGYDVFVRDRGADTIERVSVSSAGETFGEALAPSLSADGRYVAFESIRPGEDPSSFVGANDVWVHDRVTGATEQMSLNPRRRQGR